MLLNCLYAFVKVNLNQQEKLGKIFILRQLYSHTSSSPALNNAQQVIAYLHKVGFSLSSAAIR